MLKPGISLCMIVKNEQDFIKECLISAKDIVDEIIIVDTGSSDETVSIAEQFGAKMFRYTWQNSFAEARNFSLDQAGFQWILLLDADERVFAEDRQKLLEFVNGTALDGAYFKVYNYVGEEGGGQYTLHHSPRLFKNNGCYQFSGDIHEQLTRCDGESIENRFAVTDLRLHHLGYLDSVAEQKDKRHRNIPILMKELEKDPGNPFMLFNLGNEYMAMGDYNGAIDQYTKSLASYDQEESYGPHLLFRSAMCCYNTGKYGRAVELLDQGLKVYPDCTDMQYLKGLILMDWHKDILAAESFQKCMMMGEPPEELRFSDGCATSRPLCSLGNLYERQQDYKRAVACYTKAILANHSCYNSLYSIARAMKKSGADPAEIEETLVGFFADFDHAPNLIMLSDILLSTQMTVLCKPHLERLDETEGYETEKAMLWGKYCFYTGQYQTARRLLLDAFLGEEPSKVFSGLRKDCALLLFTSDLLTHTPNEDETQQMSNIIKKEYGLSAFLACKQILIKLKGGSENLFIGQKTCELLKFFGEVLKKALLVGEIQLFEQLLTLRNEIDCNCFLLTLAKVYKDCGFSRLAVSTILDSIKDLDTIDLSGAYLLAEILGESKNGK